MKIKNLSLWNLENDIEALLFFAQRMDELLFLYSLDTYKPSCLNAPFLVKEALSVVEEVENGVIDESAVKTVLDELRWSLSSDLVAKKEIESDLSYYFLDIGNSKTKDIKIRLELLSHKLKPHSYLYSAFSELKVAIAKKKKNDIDFLSNTITTTLINIGVSKRHLNDIINDYFFSDDGGQIESVDVIDDFIQKLTPSLKEYEVCFTVSSLFSQVSDVSSVFNTVIYSTYQELSDGFHVDSGLELANNQVFSVVKKVRSYDPYSAFESAESNIEKMANLYAIFHHKGTICWDKKAVIKDVEDNTVKTLLVQNNPIQNGFDLHPNKAARVLNDVIRNFRMDTDESFFKFDNVVDLHALASRSDSGTSQLVNIWISLETLTPPSTSSSKIVNISKKITPFLMLNYTTRLLQRINGDIYRWNRSEYRNILRKVEVDDGLGAYHKIAKFLMLPQYDDLRSDFYGKLDSFPLLRYRIFKLNEVFKSPKKLSSLLDRHLQKVEWQVRRIYRTRNMIVHAGKAPAYIATLVENSHDYLDQILNEIMRLVAETKESSTLEQCYEFASIKYDEYKKTLDSVDEFDDKNYASAFRDWS